MANTLFLEIFGDPDRLSVRDLRDLVEPEGFELVETSGSRWKEITSFRCGAA